jgi:hypothetical protein
VEYLLLHCFDDSVEPPSGDPTDEDLEFDRAIDAWVSELASSGVKHYGGHLRHAREAVTVRVRDGRALLTDGPFAETKEQIAGFDVLECASKEQAIEVAARHPTAKIGTFELRPFRPEQP